MSESVSAEPRIFAAVVLYQCRAQDSVTCQALIKAQIPTLLVDNSTEPNDNAAYAASVGMLYHSMGGNAGLPKAYNCAVRLLATQADVLCLFDCDTTLSADYWDVLRAALSAHPAQNLFVPRVMDAKGLLSPCRIRGCRVTRIADPLAVKAKELTAINSGTAIRMQAFQSLSYDEAMFLDYVDHAFFREARRQGTFLTVLDTVLQQDFSGNETTDLAAMRRRFSIFQRDFAYFCKEHWYTRLYAWFYIRKRRAYISYCAWRARRAEKSALAQLKPEAAQTTQKPQNGN